MCHKCATRGGLRELIIFSCFNNCIELDDILEFGFMCTESVFAGTPNESLMSRLSGAINK